MTDSHVNQKFMISENNRESFVYENKTEKSLLFF